MKVNQKTIESLIPKLNLLIDEYHALFGDVGFRHLPVKGHVHLVDKTDVSPPIQGLEETIVGAYDEGTDQIYFIRENLMPYMEELPEVISQYDRGVRFSDVEEYVLLSFLCHEGIIHRSAVTRWLEGETLELYNAVLWKLLELGGKESKFSFIKEGRSRINSRGLRIKIFDVDGEITYEPSKELDELAVHLLVGQLLALEVSRDNPGIKYLAAQSPYAYIADRLISVNDLCNAAPRVRYARNIFEFASDYLGTRIPEKLQRLVVEYSEDEEKQASVMDGIFAQFYGLPGMFTELHRLVYKQD